MKFWITVALALVALTVSAQDWTIKDIRQEIRNTPEGPEKIQLCYELSSMLSICSDREGILESTGCRLEE